MTKGRKKPNRMSRFRLRFTFWLDMHKPDEQDLAEIVETLKAQKLFAKTIRDGIRLICDLRAGNTTILFELFPWLKGELSLQPVVSTESQIQQEIAHLRQLIEGQGSAPQKTMLTGAASKLQSTVKLSIPLDDDDDGDTLVMKKVETNSAQNFLGLMGGYGNKKSTN